MDFFVRLSLDERGVKAPLAFADPTGSSPALNAVSFTSGVFQPRRDIDFGSGRAVFIGDPVFHDDNEKRLRQFLEQEDISRVIRNTDGFYYLIVIYHTRQKLVVSSGNFSIMPVFYTSDRSTLSVSSSFDILVSGLKDHTLTPDRQYYLEKALFNYPLFNRTPLKEISLLPSNSFLEYHNSIYNIRKHTLIHDLFTGSPESCDRVKNELSELFIEKARRFVPDAPCVLSLTGGLDSRTVAGVALVNGQVKGAYTYGRPDDPDIEIASEIARHFGFAFTPVILDERFASMHFWHHGMQFLKKSYGLGNISRAHYSFILHSYLESEMYLMSGNFGSEIMRSAGIAGVVTSEALFKIFRCGKGEDLAKALKTERALNYLNHSVVKETMSDLAGEIEEYLSTMPSELTVSQRFYTYIFEEVLRKYFGPEITVQHGMINHRSPFLSFSFIESLLKTGFTGANSRFAEDNPLKRRHGQVLYASIIQKLNPALLDFRLDRGYRPKDLLTWSGTLRIAVMYLKKKYTGRRGSSAPDYLTLSVAENIKNFPNVRADDEIFDGSALGRMKSGEWTDDQMNFINIMSAVIFRDLLNTSFRTDQQD